VTLAWQALLFWHQIQSSEAQIYFVFLKSAMISGI